MDRRGDDLKGSYKKFYRFFRYDRRLPIEIHLDPQRDRQVFLELFPAVTILQQKFHRILLFDLRKVAPSSIDIQEECCDSMIHAQR